MRSSEVAIDFTRAPQVYWRFVDQVEYVQRRVIVYSIMYYINNESCVSDRYFDTLAKQLVAMQSKLSESELLATKYGYALKRFDGTTGFDIYTKLTKRDRAYLSNIASHVSRLWKLSGRGVAK